METMFLSSPVAVAFDLQRHEIGTLAEIIGFLRAWPEARRGPVYRTALRACEAARDGYLTVEQARRAFLSFAEATGIAAPAIDPAIASKALARPQGGHIR